MIEIKILPQLPPSQPGEKEKINNEDIVLIYIQIRP